LGSCIKSNEMLALDVGYTLRPSRARRFALKGCEPSLPIRSRRPIDSICFSGGAAQSDANEYCHRGSFWAGL